MFFPTVTCTCMRELPLFIMALTIQLLVNFNYYHYQPGSNIIIVYCKHITHTQTHTQHTHTSTYTTHTQTHAHTHTPPSPFRLSLFDGSVVPNSDGVNAPFRRFRWRSMAGRWFIQINSRAGDSVSPRFCVFFTYNKIARPN